MLLAETNITGALRAATRKTKKVPVPANSEQLRRRYKIEDTRFIYAKYKHGSKTWLHDLTKGAFGSLADYLLGDKVLGLEAASFTNTSVPWEVVLKHVGGQLIFPMMV